MTVVSKWPTLHLQQCLGALTTVVQQCADVRCKRTGACAQGSQIEQALEVFQAVQLQGVAPDVVTWATLISACEKGYSHERALVVFHAMQRQGVVRNVIAYNALISACEKGSQPKLAL